MTVPFHVLQYVHVATIAAMKSGLKVRFQIIFHKFCFVATIAAMKSGLKAAIPLFALNIMML